MNSCLKPPIITSFGQKEMNSKIYHLYFSWLIPDLLFNNEETHSYSFVWILLMNRVPKMN